MPPYFFLFVYMKFVYKLSVPIYVHEMSVYPTNGDSK